MKSSFFEHFYDLTGPKYAEKYEDSESGLKSIHFLAKMISFWWFSFSHFHFFSFLHFFKNPKFSKIQNLFFSKIPIIDIIN